MTAIYDFTAQSLTGHDVSLGVYRGKVVLLVNTASACGFTPQFKGLEALHRAHGREGLVVLGFPCNQFASQEPGDAAEIAAFCSLNYDVTFPMMAKVEVNGARAHPLFQYLTRTKRGLLGTRNIKWNFTKFLVGRDGAVLARFGPQQTPAQIEGAVVKALG